jgi:hypothetical protein
MTSFFSLNTRVLRIFFKGVTLILDLSFKSKRPDCREEDDECILVIAPIKRGAVFHS